MLTLGVGSLVWEGAGTDLGWERVWRGSREVCDWWLGGESYLGLGAELLGCVEGSCGQGLGVYRGSSHEAGSSSRTQQPCSRLRRGGLRFSMAGCFPGRGPRVENLNKLLLGVLSSSLHL